MEKKEIINPGFEDTISQIESWIATLADGDYQYPIPSTMAPEVVDHIVAHYNKDKKRFHFVTESTDAVSQERFFFFHKISKKL